jgi:hypothetical protein
VRQQNDKKVVPVKSAIENKPWLQGAKKKGGEN